MICKKKRSQEYENQNYAHCHYGLCGGVNLKAVDGMGGLDVRET
jgi:hypothetical protein